MGFSYLTSIICRGQWMISPGHIQYLADIVSKMIDERGKDYDDSIKSEKVPLPHQYMMSGQTKMSGEGGSYSNAPAGSIAIVNLSGTMTKNGTWCNYGTQDIADQINEAATSEQISGIVLQIDSPGGCADAVAPLARAIQGAQQAGKAVVACCDLCASAAYYAATYCDEIMADNNISAEFGSIGVMISFRDYSKMEESAGIKTHTIYSNLSDYKNKPYSDALAGNYDLVKTESLDPMAQKFQAQVESQRQHLNKKCDGILSGRMFYAEDAVKNGLIDSIGSMQDAINRVKNINTINSYKN